MRLKWHAVESVNGWKCERLKLQRLKLQRLNWHRTKCPDTPSEICQGNEFHLVVFLIQWYFINILVIYLILSINRPRLFYQGSFLTLLLEWCYLNIGWNNCGIDWSWGEIIVRWNEGEVKWTSGERNVELKWLGVKKTHILLALWPGDHSSYSKWKAKVQAELTN